MKRALKFLFTFLAAAALVFALVIGLNYSGFETLFENEEGMAEGSQYIENTYSLAGLAEFIGEHPEWVSITSYNVNDPDSGIFYQEDIPRALGATSNLFLLMEYERQVAEGLLDPDETISLKEIEKFALPEISENNHNKLIEEFEGGTAPLDDVVLAMLQNSDLVSADYLWFRLGEENIRTLIDTVGMPETTLPLPFSGMYMRINPSLNDTAALSSMSFSDFAEQSISEAKKLRDDEEYNQQVKNQFNDDRLSLTFMQERDALAYFPQATTRQLADLMTRLIENRVLSEEVSEAVKEKLRWPMGSEPISRSFEDYGAIYDNRMGLLGGIDFGTSIYDGHTSVQAVFFDQLPVGFWVHMSANHMQEDYQQRLIWDPALYETTQNEMAANDE
ncbi:serine hydrolase [Gracilimonas sediminicola]|uniref:beta-lactamase n=1 Tax=Gracilimonas sediminicola TaxID=2952158 RepID=A0A9X2L471_9BACT|nr:serine hydrolase [Gracilimonas sediminicola]MCP9292071.1 class A beta-lactamase-related serine hydrolase [Gracilimonas sediminicola]